MTKNKQTIQTGLAVWALCFLLFTAFFIYFYWHTSKESQTLAVEKSEQNLFILENLKKIETALFVHQNSLYRSLNTEDKEWAALLSQSESLIKKEIGHLEDFNAQFIKNWKAPVNMTLPQSLVGFETLIASTRQKNFHAEDFQKLFYATRFQILHYFNLTSQKRIAAKSNELQLIPISEFKPQLNLILQGIETLRTSYSHIFWNKNHSGTLQVYSLQKVMWGVLLTLFLALAAALVFLIKQLFALQMQPYQSLEVPQVYEEVAVESPDALVSEVVVKKEIPLSVFAESVQAVQDQQNQVLQENVSLHKTQDEAENTQVTWSGPLSRHTTAAKSIVLSEDHEDLNLRAVLQENSSHQAPEILNNGIVQNQYHQSLEEISENTISKVTKDNLEVIHQNGHLPSPLVQEVLPETPLLQSLNTTHTTMHPLSSKHSDNEDDIHLIVKKELQKVHAESASQLENLPEFLQAITVFQQSHEQNQLESVAAEDVSPLSTKSSETLSVDPVHHDAKSALSANNYFASFQSPKPQILVKNQVNKELEKIDLAQKFREKLQSNKKENEILN